MKRFEELKNGRCSSHILPFLWMKGEPYPVIKEELDKIEACGISEICLESRPHPHFCEDGWWEVMDQLVPEAAKRGMKLWILDDKKFPTGYANGGFERQPELSKLYLAERHMDIMGPCKNSAVLVENFMVPPRCSKPDGKLLAVLAVPKPDSETLAVSPEGILDLTDQIENGFVFFDLPEEAYRLFVVFTTRSFGGRPDYMNLIDSRSVRVLLDEVYEKHYAHYADYFGNTIAGFFSDEPELGNVPGYPFDAMVGQANAKLPWSDELEDLLKAEWKADFKQNLPALWYEMGDRSAGIRSSYMDHMTDLVYTCFSGQVGGWCQEHGVEYIGHIIEDDNAHARLGCSIGHYFKEMKGQHMAGVDVVHHQIVPGFTGRVHQWIAGDKDGEFFHFGLAKLASSAAHQDPVKKDRALCEVFGNYGWGEGVSLMKWLTDHMLVRGINVFTPHAFSMTYPDLDCPPHFYARGNNPQYEAFADLMRYMQRGAHILTGGRPLIDGAVLYHAESEWTGGSYMLYQKPVRALMENQIDCDVIPAFLLNEEINPVEKKRMKVNGCDYRFLVLPQAEGEDRKVLEYALYAAKRGVMIYAINEIPGKDLSLKEFEPAFIKELACWIRVVTLDTLAAAVTEDLELSILAEKTHKDLRIRGIDQEDGRVYMFFNESVTETIETTMLLSDKHYTCLTRYDAWYNSERSETMKNGRIPLTLLPGEAAFILVEKEKTSDNLPLKKVSEEVLSCDWKVSRADELHHDSFEPYLTIEKDAELPNLNGRGYDPGFTGWYRYEAAFMAKKEAGSYHLMIPAGGDTAEIFVNGKRIGFLANMPGSVEITEALKDGNNTITLEFSTTLVWKRKDGSSTHLQLFASGLQAAPILVHYQ